MMRLIHPPRHPLRHWAAALLVALLGGVSVPAQPPEGGSLADKYPKRPAEPLPPAPREPDPRMDYPDLDHIIDGTPVMSAAENREEFLAYNYFVLQARKFSPELMARHTRPELTFRRLFEDGHKYRGEIVRVEGRLKRLTWIGSNRLLEADGVKDLYEAWIFGEHYFSNPTCVILSELPPNVTPAEDILRLNAVVDGYYFKKYRYRAVNETRLAPLVIARTLTVSTAVSTQSAGEQAFGRWFLPVVMGSLLGMVFFALLLHRWFRAGDRAAHEILERSRSTEFVAPTEQPMPLPAPRPSPDAPMWN